ncbi:Transmembrane protein 19 [Coelomomyces lativittatus]|nr:Transmembrane protein 19 [Coelomomyces lativittatus]
MTLFWSVVAFCIPFVFAIHGYKKKSLSLDGAITAFFVGVLAFSCSHPLFPALPLVFYLAGSKMTKFGAKHKKKIESGYRKYGRRTAIQVLCNSVSGSLAIIFYFIANAFNQSQWLPYFLCAYIGHYACACGDTFASEFGTAFPLQPVLITTFKKVLCF